MYSILIPKIQTTLEEVTEVKAVFSYPETKLDAFPAVIFLPSGLINTYETNNENRKVYSFTLFVIVGVAEKETEEIFTDVLANTVDAITAKFDDDWNQGTQDGHRIWATLTGSELWQLSTEQDGVTAVAPLNLEVKMLTDTA